MNPAQKRIWWTFSISFFTLVISCVVIALVKDGYIDFSNHNVYRVVGVFMTIPLLSFFLLEKVYPSNVYDERDLLIEKKATIAGTIGMFCLMAFVAIILTIRDFEGTITIQRKYLCSFVYILLFMWNLCSSTVEIAYYYFINPSKKQFLGEKSK